MLHVKKSVENLLSGAAGGTAGGTSDATGSGALLSDVGSDSIVVAVTPSVTGGTETNKRI